MANEQHIQWLLEGVEAWNQRREENRDIDVDLSGSDLTGNDLTGADLTGASLFDANLTSANLTSANLAYANLTSANLTSANLTSAVLIYANLTNTFLFNLRSLISYSELIPEIFIVSSSSNPNRRQNAFEHRPGLSWCRLSTSGLKGMRF